MVICPSCGSTIEADRVIGNSAVCRCGWSGSKAYKLENERRRLWRWVGRLIAVLATCFALFLVRDFRNYGRMGANRMVLRAKDLLGLETFSEWKQLALLCQHFGRARCAEESSRQALSIHSEDTQMHETLALAQVELKNYESAVAGFERVFASGKPGYMAMAGMGRALQAKGDLEGAKKWYYRALVSNPRVTDVADSLIDLLVLEKKFVEAMSLIGNLSEQDPQVRRYLRGRLLTLSDLAETKSPGARQTIRLASTDNHHFLPVRLAGMNEPAMFLVDTGATNMQVSWEFLQDHQVTEFTRVQDVVVSLGDGALAMVPVVVIKRLAVGPWVIENVRATACSGCPLLAGKSLLRHFQTATRYSDGVEYLLLRR